MVLSLNRPESPSRVAKRLAIAEGRRHVVQDLSYAEGWSECSCGHREEQDLRLRSIPRRHADLAQRMNAHIALANGRKAAPADEVAETA